MKTRFILCLACLALFVVLCGSDAASLEGGIDVSKITISGFLQNIIIGHG